jgi:transposase
MYSVVQRKLRMRLKDTNSTLPNQIKKQTATPTLRWIFQMLQGINYIVVRINGTIQTVVDNITDLRRKIILLFGPE